MFHVRGVLFAFLRTNAARAGAGAELRADEFLVRGGEAGDDAGGGEADIRAVEIEANASALGGDIFLTEAGIGAGIARFGAGIAGGDAFTRRGVIRGGIEGMRLKHLLDVTHGKSSRGRRGALVGFRSDSSKFGRWSPSHSRRRTRGTGE